MRVEEWALVHLVSPRPLMACPDCGVRMGTVESKLGLRFFRHDHAVRECSMNGETLAHRNLKRALAHIIRSAPGWTVHIESGLAKTTRAAGEPTYWPRARRDAASRSRCNWPQ
jgi:hypothetical protein